MRATRTVCKPLAPTATRGRRALAAVLLSGFLSLLMVWDSGPAHADVVTTTVSTAAASTGEVAASSEVKILSRAVCATGVACAIIGGASVAIIAGGLTHDVWMPWIENKVKELITAAAGPETFILQVVSGSGPAIGADSPAWWPEVRAPNVDRYSVSLAVASVCRTTGGLRYQVNKGVQWTLADGDGSLKQSPILTQDPFYTGPVPHQSFAPGATVAQWNTDYTTPATALDGSTPNPAHGRSGGTVAQDAADQTSLCNFGDIIEGVHAVYGQGGQTTTKTYDYGTAADPNAVPWDTDLDCRKPSGDTYTVRRTATPATAGQAGNILWGHCEAGDIVLGGTVSQGGKQITAWANPNSGVDTATAPATAVLPVASWTASSSYQSWTPEHLGDGVAGDNATAAWATCGAHLGSWVQADLGQLSNLSGYDFWNRGNDYSSQPSEWTARVSRDGTNWVDLDRQVNRLDVTGSKPSFAATGTGRYVRWTLSANHGGGCMSLAEIQPRGSSALAPASGSPTPSCVGATPQCTWVIKLNGVQCVPSTNPAAPCYAWTALAHSSPSAVECKYGPYVMPLEKCWFMERSFQGLEVPATAKNTDGDPATWDPPAPQLQPTASPTATASPTVSQSPAPTGSPSVGGTPIPGTTWTPAPGPTASDGTAGAPDPFGTQTPSPEDQSCWGGMVSWNPADWVLTPVKCALSWAFVPPDLTGDLGGFKDGAGRDIDNSAIGGWKAVVVGWGDAFGAGGAGTGCQGPPVDIGFLSNGTHVAKIQYPFDACSGVKATAAATSRIFLTIAICWLTGWRLVRIVGRPFGYSVELMNDRNKY